MLRRHLWKLTLSAALVLWAVFTLMPLKDQPFGDFVKQEATAKPAEFSKLMGEVATRVQAGRAPSVYVALKQIGLEQKLDLSQFFPEIRLESTLKNVEKRNNILLDELLRRSKGKLQLGLDLKGGVAFTLEVNPDVASADNQQVREEKLSKAVEIIGNRINGLGVTEPIIRPIGANRIEVQLPGVSTKDNPEVAASLVKPARLDFKMVHPLVAPPQEAPPGYERMTLDQEGRAGNESYTEELYVKTRPEMTGEGVADSYPTMDEFGRFRIILKFTDTGSKQFADVTKAIADEGQRSGRLGRLAIVLDGKLYSAPTVREQISGGSAEISGSFTQREAVDLSNVLNNPLDLPLQTVLGGEGEARERDGESRGVLVGQDAALDRQGGDREDGAGGSGRGGGLGRGLGLRRAGRRREPDFGGFDRHRADQALAPRQERPPARRGGHRLGLERFPGFEVGDLRDLKPGEADS